MNDDETPDEIPPMIEAWIEEVHAKHAGRPGTTPLEIVRDHFPFDVQPEHLDTQEYRLLRLWGDFIAVGPKTLPEDKLAVVRDFHRKLRDENLILEYDPNAGWAWRERQLEDEDSIVRENDFTHISDEGELIWRFPPPGLEP